MQERLALLRALKATKNEVSIVFVCAVAGVYIC
jgi:hypothetical protein